MALKIARGSDPFKKYWWAILLIFALAGAWVCLPLMGGTGSGSVASGEAGLHPADQSLDAVKNPDGAPGHVVDLSMDGSGPYKKFSGPITDALYQSPADASAQANAAVASAKSSGGTLADALKDIARARASSRGGSAGSASVAMPFNAAHASFGSMSGLGGGSSGSSAGASYGGSAGGGTTSMSAFGAASPHVGVDYTQGLSAGKGQAAGAGAKNALQAAAAGAVEAAQTGHLDAAAGRISRSFDGGGAGGLVNGPGQSQGGVGINGGTVADLKASVNDYSKLNVRTVEPPAAVPKMAADQGPNMMQMLMMSLPMLLM